MGDVTPMRRHTLAERCRIHADKMQGEGWYVTANVLWEAAEALDKVGYEIPVNLPFDQPPSGGEDDDCECGEDTCVCQHPTNAA